jgi:hypothetical protein
LNAALFITPKWAGIVPNNSPLECWRSSALRHPVPDSLSVA